MSSVGTANIAGLASGLNFNNIVSQLMAVEQQKVSLLKNQQTQQQTVQTALTTLNNDLLSLRTQAQGLSDFSTFLSYSSSLTNTSTTTDPTTLLSVTPGATALPGTHTIQVNSLAKAEQYVSSGAIKASGGSTGVTSSTTALGYSGSFTITGQGNSAQTVTIAANDSLSDIVSKINALNQGNNATGVTASVLQASSSSSSTGDYRLVITADNTGTSPTGTTDPILLQDTSGVLSSLNITAGTPTTNAVDASIKVDGVSISRSSNTITDALSGYTLNLLKAESGTNISVTTAADNTAVTKKIQGFVDAYNKVMKEINAQMAFDPQTNTQGVLASNATVRSIQSQLSSEIMQSVPGLASDRNSLVLMGIAPDSSGQLQIDSTMLDNFLNSDPQAVSKVFAATGSSNNSSLTFLTNGLNSTSGSYAVNITQAASQASVTGTKTLAAPATLAANEAFSVTDGFGRKTDSSFQLTGGDSLAQIVSALNTEFNTSYTQQLKMSTALSAGGSAVTSSTTLSSLGLGVKAGDTISITGTTRGGTAVNSGFTVVDPTTDTVGNLLSAIQVAFNQQVTATVDSSGNINITDASAGDSHLSFNLTANNEGGGTLNFGSESVVTEGRYPMALSAVATTGNQLQILSNGYGSSGQVSVAEASATNYLGLNGASSTGADVAGTIGGLAATGAGQTLTGTAGSADGMALSYTGSTTGSIGTMTASLGIGSVYDGLINTFANPVSGMIQNDIYASQNTYNDLQTQITDLQARIKVETNTLTQSYLQMEQTIGQLNSTNQYIAQQFGSSSSSSSSSSSGTSTA